MLDQEPPKNEDLRVFRFSNNFIIGVFFFLGFGLIAVLFGFLNIPGLEALHFPPDRPAAEIAPDFQVNLFEASTPFQLSRLRGKGVIVNFWASWCFPCKQEMPVLEAAWQKYADQGIAIIGVNVWDQDEDVAAFLDEYPVSFPIGLDKDDQVAKSYLLQGIPTTWFITPDGEVSRKVYGPVAHEILEEEIQKILP